VSGYTGQAALSGYTEEPPCFLTEKPNRLEPTVPHPFTSPNHPCRGCFLEQQRGGRVCPAAREIHGLPDVGAERRAAPLHAAILRDASPAPSFTELVHRDAVNTGPLPAAMVFSLDSSVAYSVHPDPPKEVPDALAIRIAIPARTSR
jgi:hypothetical protein